MRSLATVGLCFGLLGGVAAHAGECPGNPDAIGTSRVLTIDPADYPLVGRMQYRHTLPLNDHEVVLTFDDGPLPPYTTRVLETLASECVKANYFIIGRMARGYPALLKRILADGHVIGTHSENHPLSFHKMPMDKVEQEIEQGIASTGAALGDPNAVAPFFRIPGLLRRDAVETYLRSRHIVSWSADVPADDWKHISASEVVRRTITRLEEKGSGIILLHDIQPATALALPTLLKELKKRGYKIVQVRPAGGASPLIATAPAEQATGSAAPAAEKPLPTTAWPTALAPSRLRPAQPPGMFEAHVSPNEPAPPPPAATTARTEPPSPAAKTPPSVSAAVPPAPVRLPELAMPAPAAPANAPEPIPLLRSLMAPKPMAMPASSALPHEESATSALLTPQTARPLMPMLKPAANGILVVDKTTALRPGEQRRSLSDPTERMAYAKGIKRVSVKKDARAGAGTSAARPRN